MINYEDYRIRTAESRGSQLNTFLSYLFDRVTCLFIKSKPVEIKNPRKILLIRNDHIGDMAQSTHAFREIKRFFPKAELTVIADPVNKTLIEKDKNVDKIIVAERFWNKRTLKSFFDYLKVLKKIKKGNFDIGIDLRRSRLNIFFFLYLPKIKIRASYYNINGGKAFLNRPLLYEKKMHATKETIDLINKALGINSKNYELDPIATDSEDEKDVNNFLKSNNIKKYIAVCPGATTTTKQWPKAKLMKFIRIFSEKYPSHKIIISSGSNDAKLISSLCKISKSCMPLINFNLRRLSVLFKKADAVIANDGGAREIAWVSGANVVSLSGPVDLEIHSPLKNSVVVHHKLPCYPCDWSKPCKRPLGVWCMDLITPEEVLRVVNNFIDKKYISYHHKP